MLPKIEWWRKELTARFKSFFSKSKKPTYHLCTVTFLFDVKGIIGAGKNKVETVFAYLEGETTKEDCISLFNPPNLGKGQCTIKDIIIFKIPTVEHK